MSELMERPRPECTKLTSRTTKLQGITRQTPKIIPVRFRQETRRRPQPTTAREERPWLFLAHRLTTSSPSQLMEKLLLRLQRREEKKKRFSLLMKTPTTLLTYEKPAKLITLPLTTPANI